jgi:hypothetical protein
LTNEEIVQLARDKFKLAQEREQDTRDEGLEDLKFARLGEQWPDFIRRQREGDPYGPRPCLTENRLRPFIYQVVNEVRQNKPGIIVHPADDGADKDTAEVFNGLIRNIQVTSDGDVATDTAAESAVSNGFGYFRINITEEGPDLAFERIANPFTVYGDPHGESVDGSDWNCCFVVSMLGRDEFEAAYPTAETSDFDTDFTGIESPWREEDRIMVAEYWHREGDKVTQYILNAAEVLETNEWPGKFIPIVPVYGDEINVEGKRYFRSLINQAKDSQRRFNYWLTAATEMVALAPRVPFIGEEGAFDIDPRWNTAHSANHAYLEHKRGTQRPSREPFDGVPAGMVQAMLSAADGIKAVLGVYDASLGNKSNETSGVAIRQRQMEGDVATFHFIDNVSRALRHAGRILIDLIPKVYNSQRVVRILGEDMKPRNVKIGPADPMQEAMQAFQGMQEQQEQVDRIYDLSAGKYDLVVKVGPGYTSLREETRAELIEIIRSVPESAQVLGPMYLRQSDWPGADEAADKIEAGGIPPEVQEEMDGLRAQLAENDIKAQELALKQEELRIKAMEAETDRIRAQAEAAYGPMLRGGAPATEPFRAVA